MGCTDKVVKISFITLSCIFALFILYGLIYSIQNEFKVGIILFFAFLLVFPPLNIYGALRESWIICGLFATIFFIPLVMEIIDCGNMPKWFTGEETDDSEYENQTLIIQALVFVGIQVIYFGLAVYLTYVFWKKRAAARY